ncbi:MAG TPA: FG-GAP-like repeat-containing protein, partial [Saprospiraceae bacterium]|nr:FG-GAP-like repeat-containing protein [Saprospiraceae bacterium]
QLTFSNGSAYADLDNDGLLDLVVNNVNMPSQLFKNIIKRNSCNWVQFKLIGEGLNSNAIGTKIIVKSGTNTYMMEHNSAKGFQSSVVDKLHFGLGPITVIDSVEVFWPRGKKTILTDIKSNQILSLYESEALLADPTIEQTNQRFTIDYNKIPFTHQEFDLNLFTRERLLLEMPGFTGPALAVADVNGDGIEDYFIGGGRGQNCTLFLSDKKSNEYVAVIEPFESIKNSESVRALWVDVDVDGDLDLYVANGGKSFSTYDRHLDDALFINQGKGVLERNNTFATFPKALPTADVDTLDVNQDGLIDFVICEQFDMDTYGLPRSCYTMINQGNGFFAVKLLEGTNNIGMVTSIKAADLNGDGFIDIVLSGQWMPIIIIYNDGKQFENPKIQKIKTVLDCGIKW